MVVAIHVRPGDRVEVGRARRARSHEDGDQLRRTRRGRRAGGARAARPQVAAGDGAAGDRSRQRRPGALSAGCVSPRCPIRSSRTSRRALMASSAHPTSPEPTPLRPTCAAKRSKPCATKRCTSSRLRRERDASSASSRSSTRRCRRTVGRAARPARRHSPRAVRLRRRRAAADPLAARLRLGRSRPLEQRAPAHVRAPPRAGGAGIGEEFLVLVRAALAHYGIAGLDTATRSSARGAAPARFAAFVRRRHQLALGVIRCVTALAQSGVELAGDAALEDALSRIAGVRGLVPPMPSPTPPSTAPTRSSSGRGSKDSPSARASGSKPGSWRRSSSPRSRRRTCCCTWPTRRAAASIASGAGSATAIRVAARSRWPPVRRLYSPKRRCATFPRCAATVYDRFEFAGRAPACSPPPARPRR